MNRLRQAASLSILVALLHVTLAVACMNDRETVRTESEFKKHYEFKSGYQQGSPAESSPTGTPWTPIAATFSGIGLLAGSIALVRGNVRRSRRS
jgi:hypothetical protein